VHAACGCETLPFRDGENESFPGLEMGGYSS